MKTVYWVSTGLLGIFLLWSAFSYFFHKPTIDGLKSLGFPDFFRIELGILKLLAVGALTLPFIPVQMKEWAYAGVGLFLITGMVAHLVHKDTLFIFVSLLFIFGLLVTSNIYLHRMVS